MSSGEGEASEGREGEGRAGHEGRKRDCGGKDTREVGSDLQ